MTVTNRIYGTSRILFLVIFAHPYLLQMLWRIVNSLTVSTRFIIIFYGSHQSPHHSQR